MQQCCNLALAKKSSTTSSRPSCPLHVSDKSRSGRHMIGLDSRRRCKPLETKLLEAARANLVSLSLVCLLEQLLGCKQQRSISMYFLESKTAAATGKLQTSQRCPIMVTVSREAFHGFPPLATESPSNQHQTRGAPLLSAASAHVACQKREVSTEHNVWMPVQTPNKSRKCYELSQAHDSSCIATITNIYTSYIDLIQKHYSRGVWTPQIKMYICYICYSI